MTKFQQAIALTVSFFNISCSAIPKNDVVVFAKITTVFKEVEYRNAIDDKSYFKGFFDQRKLSMLEAAIREGVTLNDLKAQRFVAVECSCGTECYSSYPLLLPEKVSFSLHELVSLKTGINQWQQERKRYNYTLGKYQKHLTYSPENWIRMGGNHSALPVCDPAQWEGTQ